MAHEIEIPKKNDGVQVAIDMYDQYRTPMTPEMIVISMNNYKYWMNSGFFIEFELGADAAQIDAEMEVF